jgi:hypothetical protein
MATATDPILREMARRKADALFSRAAAGLDAVASFAADHGGTAQAAGAALADVAGGWWADVLTATCHALDQRACFHADPRGLAVVGPGLLALLDGWEEFAAELGLDPDWSWRPGADMVKRTADAVRGDPAVVNFDRPRLTAGQVATSLRRRLDSAASWWAGAGAGTA